jgi:hypothetical protein
MCHLAALVNINEDLASSLLIAMQISIALHPYGMLAKLPQENTQVIHFVRSSNHFTFHVMSKSSGIPRSHKRSVFAAVRIYQTSKHGWR